MEIEVYESETEEPTEVTEESWPMREKKTNKQTSELTKESISKWALINFLMQ